MAVTTTTPEQQPAKKGSPRTAATTTPHQPLKLHTQTLIDWWDHGTPEEQLEFVKARRVDILRVQQKLGSAETQLWTPEQLDDGLEPPAACSRSDLDPAEGGRR